MEEGYIFNYAKGKNRITDINKVNESNESTIKLNFNIDCDYCKYNNVEYVYKFLPYPMSLPSSIKFEMRCIRCSNKLKIGTCAETVTENELCNALFFVNGEEIKNFCAHHNEMPFIIERVRREREKNEILRIGREESERLRREREENERLTKEILRKEREEREENERLMKKIEEATKKEANLQKEDMFISKKLEDISNTQDSVFREIEYLSDKQKINLLLCSMSAIFNKLNVIEDMIRYAPNGEEMYAAKERFSENIKK